MNSKRRSFPVNVSAGYSQKPIGMPRSREGSTSTSTTDPEFGTHQPRGTQLAPCNLSAMRCGTRGVRTLTQSPAPSQSCIWVSDEFLEPTFSRFVRMRPNQHRDYHDHKPGPLEFRRRQMKRRMASMTFNDPSQQAIASQWPSLSHLGSLFRPRPAPDTQWSWEAPGKSKLSSKLDRAPQNAQESETSLRRSYEQAVSELDSIRSLRALYWKWCPIGDAAVIFSKAAFQRILQLVDARRESIQDPNALQLLFDFMDSDMNIREARNAQSFLAWSMVHQSWTETSERVTNYIAQCIRLDKLSTSEIRSILDVYQTQQVAMPFSAQILSSVSMLCESVEKWLIAHTGTRSQLTVAEVFVQFLDALPSNWTISSTLIRCIANLPDAIRHDYDGLLRDHIANCTRLDLELDGPSRLSTLLRQSVDVDSSINESSRNWWYEVLLDVTHALISIPQGMSRDSKMLGHWISAIKNAFHTDDRHQDLWSRLDSIFHQQHNREAIMQHILQPIHQMPSASQAPLVIEHPIPRYKVECKLAIAQIHDFLAKGDVKRAARRFMFAPAVPLSSCEGLVFKMVSRGTASPVILRKFLERKDKDNSVPVSIRQHPMTRLSERRVRFVENLAYQISMSTAYSHRQAFRTVQALHQYLTEQHVSASPIMSRALIRAGITRLLRDEIVVSRERLLWIMRIVRQAEGPQVADELDILAGRWMKAVRRKASEAGSSYRPTIPVRHATDGRSQGQNVLCEASKSKSRTASASQRKIHVSKKMYRLRGIGSRYVVSTKGVRPMMECSKVDSMPSE